MTNVRYAGLFFYLTAAAVTDIRKREVSIRTAGAAAVLAAVLHIMAEETGLCVWLSGLIPGILVLLTGRATKEAIGYGDGIAILICGLFLGVRGCMGSVISGLFLTFPVSLILLIRKKADRKSRIPFLPFLLAGYGIWLLTELGN